jgi:hypothetical protein
LPQLDNPFIICLFFSSKAACKIFDNLTLDFSLFNWDFQKSSSLFSASKSISFCLSGSRELYIWSSFCFSSCNIFCFFSCSFFWRLSIFCCSFSIMFCSFSLKYYSGRCQSSLTAFTMYAALFSALVKSIALTQSFII